MVRLDQDTLCWVLGFLVRKELCVLQFTSSRLNSFISTRFGHCPSLHVRILRAFWGTSLGIEFYKSPPTTSAKTTTTDNDNDDEHCVDLEPSELSLFNFNITTNAATAPMVPTYVRVDLLKIDVRTEDQVRLLKQVLMCFDSTAFVGCHFVVYSWPEVFPTRHSFTTFLRSSPLCSILKLAASIRIVGPHLPRHLDTSAKSTVDDCALLSLFHNVQKVEVDFWFGDEWSLAGGTCQSSNDVSNISESGSDESDESDEVGAAPAVFGANSVLTIDFLEIADWLHADSAPPHTNNNKTIRHAVVSALSLSYHQVACVQLIELLIKRFMEHDATEASNRGRHRPFRLEMTGCVAPVQLAVCQQCPMRNRDGELLVVKCRQVEFRNYVISVERRHSLATVDVP